MSEDKISYSNLYEGLATLQSPGGSVPETRMNNAAQVRDVVTRAIRYDMNERDRKRALLKGLVDGNPPYKRSLLVAAGRGDECNVNWRIAKYFLSIAQGMLYDVFSQAETYADVVLDGYKLEEEFGKNLAMRSFSKDMIPEWSAGVTEEFDRLQRRDSEFDFNNQISQGQSVMYGTGPMIFEDTLDWRPWAIESRTLFVPEFARSDLAKWEWAATVLEYTPDRLYGHIMDPDHAANWNVAETRKSIMHAHPLTRTGVMYQNWSWHQDLLKNGTFYYADQSKMIRCAHFYFREFPKDGEDEGRITETIIDLDGLSQNDSGSIEFLYFAHREYANWREIIHPMFWAHDINGYYHSVNGLGLEMYSALEYENRLLCRIADDAFAPKLFFKPTTASERERMSIAQVGRYGILPAALEMVQQHVQPFLQDGIAMSREIQNLVSSNLSQFRSQALQKQQGNPATATQINYEASEQAKMGATQLSRIYEQYDWLYAEKYRRAINPKLTSSVRGGAEAVEFVKRCKRRGIPKEALQCIDSVKANRAVGQGSAFLRQQALEFLLGLMQTLPEAGRTNLIRDVVAARTGQSKVDRYAPRGPNQDPGIAAQESDAMLQVSAMKQGIPPVPVPTQNPMIYASTFLQAAQGAVQSIQQGADPHEGLAFLHVAIPAIAQHIQRMAGDKTREGAVKQMSEQLNEISSFADQAGAQLQKQQQEQAQMQQQMAQIQSGQDPETQLGLAKIQSSHAIKQQNANVTAQLKFQKQQSDFALAARRQQGDLALQAQKQQVENAIKDATTAHGLRLSTVETAAKIAQDKAKAAANGHSNGKSK